MNTCDQRIPKLRPMRRTPIYTAMQILPVQSKQIISREIYALNFKHPGESLLQRAAEVAGVPLGLRTWKGNIGNDAAGVDLGKLAAGGGWAEAVANDAAALRRRAA